MVVYLRISNNDKTSPGYPMNSSILKGVNNRIKVIKRMAYGFRDSACFFLKIKAAFPRKSAMNR